MGDGAAGRKRIDPGGADIARPQRAGPIERQAPDQPAHQDWRTREADEATEAADVFDRNFTEIAQRVVEFRQRNFVGRGELLEEQRRRTAPRPLDDHGEDTVRARLYLHPDSVLTVVIERAWRGAAALFFEQFAAPDKASLAELDNALRNLRKVPVENVGSFRRLIRFSRPPVLVRRLIWSLALYWSGPLRARYIGTAGINPFPTGGTITQSAMPTSFMLYFGLVEPNGEAQIQIFYDHRIMDGIELYRILRDLEATMNRDIVAELRQLATDNAPGSAVTLAPAAE